MRGRRRLLRPPIRMAREVILIVVSQLHRRHGTCSRSELLLGVNLDKNLFTTDTSATGFGISAASQKAGSKVNEIGILAIDDLMKPSASAKSSDNCLSGPSSAGYAHSVV